MRYFYDFEFEENGITIIPISLGMVADDGRELYIINKEYVKSYWESKDYYFPALYHPTFKSRPSQWLKDNVLSQITEEDIEKYGVDYIQWGFVIAQFMEDIGGGNYTSRDEIELVGWYAAYDHVALAQIYGPMIELPEPIPMFTRELEDFRKGQDTPGRDVLDLPEHQALYDAMYQKQIYDTWTAIKK